MARENATAWLREKYPAIFAEYQAHMKEKKRQTARDYNKRLQEAYQQTQQTAAQ